jgi:hypothetical protein
LATEVASPKSTGGGGFRFENKVAAFYALHLLASRSPLDASLGSLRRVRFQTKPDGWLLDDILLEFVTSGVESRAAVSVKSDREITARLEFGRASRDGDDGTKRATE